MSLPRKNQTPNDSSNGERDSERKASIRRKQQKSRSARDCRVRERLEYVRAQEMFKKNEKKIEELEELAKEYMKELGSASSSSKSSGKSNPTQTTSQNTKAADSCAWEDNRPQWFGEPFWLRSQLSHIKEEIPKKLRGSWVRNLSDVICSSAVKVLNGGQVNPCAYRELESEDIASYIYFLEK